MTPEQWLYVSILLLVASNLATVLYAVHVRQRAADDGPGAGAQAADAGDGGDSGEAVTCAECGAHNERGYRYCRNCAAELPGVWVGGTGALGQGNRSFE